MYIPLQRKQINRVINVTYFESTILKSMSWFLVGIAVMLTIEVSSVTTLSITIAMRYHCPAN